MTDTTAPTQSATLTMPLLDFITKPVDPFILEAVATVTVPVMAYKATPKGMAFRVLVYPPAPRRLSLSTKAIAVATASVTHVSLAFKELPFPRAMLPVAYAVDARSADLLRLAFGNERGIVSMTGVTAKQFRDGFRGALRQGRWQR